MIDRVSHRLIQAPATCLETISTLSETLRFTYSETLGKWPIGDLAFGINFLIKRQGLLHVDRVFGGEGSIQTVIVQIARSILAGNGFSLILSGKQPSPLESSLLFTNSASGTFTLPSVISSTPTLSFSRSSLNVIAAEKGVVVGRLIFSDNGDMIDCQRRSFCYCFFLS